MQGVTPVGIGLNPPATGSPLSSGPATPPAPGSAEYVLSGTVPADLTAARELIDTTMITMDQSVAGILGLNLSAAIQAQLLDPSGTFQDLSAGIFWATRLPTLVQLQGASSTPLKIALGTPNSTIVPLFLMGRIDPGSNFNTTQNIRLRYTGIATDLMTLGSFVTNTGLFRFQQTNVPIAQAFTDTVTADPRGLDVELSLSANVTGGGPCNTTFWMLYTRLLSTF